MPQVDLATIVLAVAGLGLAIGLAILAGTVTARVFFDASRGQEDESTQGSMKGARKT
jgi:hypothetical protein